MVVVLIYWLGIFVSCGVFIIGKDRELMFVDSIVGVIDIVYGVICRLVIEF